MLIPPLMDMPDDMADSAKAAQGSYGGPGFAQKRKTANRKAGRAMSATMARVFGSQRGTVRESARLPAPRTIGGRTVRISTATRSSPAPQAAAPRRQSQSGFPVPAARTRSLPPSNRRAETRAAATIARLQGSNRGSNNANPRTSVRSIGGRNVRISS